jgi:hypothetical protein
MLGDTFGDSGAGGANDFEASASAFPSLDDDEDGGFMGAPPTSAPSAPSAPTQQQPQPRSQPGSAFVSAFERDPVPAPNVSVTGHDDLSAFENQFPEVETAPPPPPAQVCSLSCCPSRNTKG